MKISEKFDDLLRTPLPSKQTIEFKEIEVDDKDSFLSRVIWYLRRSPNSIFKIVAPDMPGAYLISEKLYKSIRDTIQLCQDDEYLRELKRRRDAPADEYRTIGE
jgi:hypothetical protein